MKSPIRIINKGYTILSRRIREHGWRTTLIWMFGRGVPKLTGVPLLRFSAVTPHLYVGPQYGKRGKLLLERKGIHYGVNMRIEYDDHAYGLSLKNYLHLPTIDDSAPTLEHLEQGVAFIKEAVAQEGKVYIHCAGGIGRAPTMAVAYLLTTGMTLDEAIETISKVRPFIYLMPSQLEQLQAFSQRNFELQPAVKVAETSNVTVS